MQRHCLTAPAPLWQTHSMSAAESEDVSSSGGSKGFCWEPATDNTHVTGLHKLIFGKLILGQLLTASG